jgi:TPR repeat protein
MLLALVRSHFDTLVSAQLCSPQGVAMFSFLILPPRVPRPFAGAPVYDMSLTHAERLRAMGCGFKGRLVRLLALGVGRHFEPQRNRRACHKMMQMNARRVASKLMAAVRDEAAKEAEELCASGQCADALILLQRAIDFGDMPSRALKAWLLSDGREGVAPDKEQAFDMVRDCTRLGCHHCQGVLACFYFFGCGCEVDIARSLQLARKSAGRGSKYGQYTLGYLHMRSPWSCKGGLEFDEAQAVAFFRLAAAQGLDLAQCQLGIILQSGYCVVRDRTEGLRMLHLAAAQGYPEALNEIAECYEHGCGVAADVAEAIRWFRRAQSAGYPIAAGKLQVLSASLTVTVFTAGCSAGP